RELGDELVDELGEPRVVRGEDVRCAQLDPGDPARAGGERDAAGGVLELTRLPRAQAVADLARRPVRADDDTAAADDPDREAGAQVEVDRRVVAAQGAARRLCRRRRL